MIGVWRSLSRLLGGSRRLVLASLGISLLQSLLLIPVALLVRHTFDVLIPSGDTGSLLWIGALILTLYLASAGCGLLTRYMSLRVTKDSVMRLRAALLEKLYSLPRVYFDRNDLGTLHSTIVQDSERLDVMGQALVALLLPPLVVSAALGITLLVLQPVLCLLLVPVFPLLLILSRVLGRTLRGRTRIYQRRFDVFSAQTLLALRGMTLTKVHGAEQVELGRRHRQLDDLRHAGRAMAWFQQAYTLVNGAVAAAVGVIVLVIGGRAVAAGSMTLGDLASFFAVLALLRGQASTILIAIPAVISGIESLRRLEEILETRAAEPYRGTRRLRFRGEIALERVDFGYGKDPVLRDVTLRIEPREHVALLGPNGAGKSTVVALMLGLYRPQRGRLLADGIPIEELDLRALRRQIGVGLQDPLIFPGTVGENIAYGRPKADIREIRRAAALATADSVVAELPDGYETRVGDDGVLLSGGQRRRIAIARALMGEPELLILDEPTTHLDDAAITGLMASLRRPGAPGVLLVSHDESLARQADRVYVMRDGRIVREETPSAGMPGDLPAPLSSRAGAR